MDTLIRVAEWIDSMAVADHSWVPAAVGLGALVGSLFGLLMAAVVVL